MAFRFRRTLKILPGIRLNLSRSSILTSVGIRGAHVTVGHGKVRTTVGLPGSDLSYTHVEGTHQEAHSEGASGRGRRAIAEGQAWRSWLWIAPVIAVSTANGDWLRETINAIAAR